MKKTFLLLFMLILSLCVFANDLDLSYLNTYFQSQGYKSKVSQEDNLTYISYEKKMGQFYNLIDFTIEPGDKVNSIFIKSAHNHLNPSMNNVRINFEKLGNFVEKGITNKNLKNILDESFKTLPLSKENDDFSESLITGKNSIEMRISKKIPEVDFSQFIKNNSSN